MNGRDPLPLFVAFLLDVHVDILKNCCLLTYVGSELGESVGIVGDGGGAMLFQPT